MTLLETLRDLPRDPVRLPLFGSPLPALMIVLVYLLMILKIGPDFMKFRKPYNVRSAMLIYNILQIAMNAIIFVTSSYNLFVRKPYDFRCMETLPLEHPDKYMERWLSYAYFLNKVLDLADTLFFVLRKSYKQITVLHVYHHAFMTMFVPTVYYFYGAGGQYYVTGYINCLVHVVMYGYYFLAAWRPEPKEQLWLKKGITQLQILQFMILIAQAALTLWLNPGCSFPKSMQTIQLVISVSVIVMFGNFYYQTYIRAKSKGN